MSETTPVNINMNGAQIIQNGENADITATVVNLKDVGLDGVPVYFYESFVPCLELSSDKSIIQSGEVADISVKAKDIDGSILKNTPDYFYVEE